MKSEARPSISANLKSPPVASASAYGLAVSAPQFFIKGLQRGDFTVVHRPQRVNAQQFVTLIEQEAALWLPKSTGLIPRRRHHDAAIEDLMHA